MSPSIDLLEKALSKLSRQRFFRKIKDVMVDSEWTGTAFSCPFVPKPLPGVEGQTSPDLASIPPLPAPMGRWPTVSPCSRMPRGPRERPMSTELRCKQCRTLLAKREPDGLAIRRGTLQATISGVDATVSVTCYRCLTLNVMRISQPSPRSA